MQYIADLFVNILKNMSFRENLIKGVIRDINELVLCLASAK